MDASESLSRPHHAVGGSLHGFLWVPESRRIYRPHSPGVRHGRAPEPAGPGSGQSQLCSASGSNRARRIPSAKEPILLYLGATHGSIFPVRALVDYIAVRSPEPGPLFIYRAGTPLTRSRLVCEVQEALRQAGIPPTAWNSTNSGLGQRPQPQNGRWKIP